MSSTSSTSVETLVSRAIAKDHLAFEALVHRHYGMVFSVSLARIRDPEQAEELAQEVFVRAYLNLDKVKNAARFPVWLCQMTKNLVVDRLRRRETSSRLFSMIPVENLPEEIHPHGDDARKICQSREEQLLVRQAVDKLLPHDREVILLHFIQGMSKSEIARHLQVHPSSVGRRLERALGTLRADLGSTFSEKLHCLSPARGSAAAIGIVAAIASLPATSKAAMVTATSADAAAAWNAAQAGTVATTLLAKGAIVAKGKFLLAAAAGVMLIGGGFWITSHRKAEKLISATSSKTRVNSTPDPRLLLRTAEENRGGAGTSGNRARADHEKLAAALPVVERTISGSVKDPGGKNVPGAKVRMNPAATMNSLEPVSAAETQSDTDGRFSFQIRGAGSVNLAAECAGFRPSRAGKVVIEKNTENVPEMELRLRVSHFLAGTVRNINGGVAAGTTVTAQGWEGDDDSIGTAVTGPDGRYRIEGLSEKPHYIGLESKEYGEETGGEINTGTDEADFFVGRVRNRPYYAMVIDAQTNEAVRDFSVKALGDEKPQIEIMAAEPGVFRVSGFKSDKGRVRIEAPGYGVVLSRPFSGPMGDEPTYQMIRMGTPCTVSGTVTELESGKPIVGAKVCLQESFDELDYQTVQTDNDGHFVLETGQRGSYALRASAPGRATSSPTVVKVSDNGSPVQAGVIALQKGASFKLVTSGLSPLRSYIVYSRQGPYRKSGQFAPDGTISLDDLPSELLELGGFSVAPTEFYGFSFTAKSGETREVRLGSGSGRISVSVLRNGMPAENSRVYLTQTREEVKIARHSTSMSGFSNFDNVAEGEWDIIVSDNESREEAVAHEVVLVQPGETIQKIFEIPPKEEKTKNEESK